MNPAPRPDSFELGDYTGVLRRRWWVILAVALLGLAGAMAYVVVGPKSYTATAAVAVTAPATSAPQSGTGHGTSGSTVNMDNDAQIVQSINVAAAAAKLMQSTAAPAQLVKDVSVTVPANSQVLQINCRAPRAAAAAQCANAFAHAFLAYQSTLATTTLQQELITIQNKMRALETEIVALRAKVKNLPATSTARYAAGIQLTADIGQLHALGDQVAPLTAQQANASGGSVITPATPPTSPASPRKLLVLPSGLLAGLVIGLAAAFAADRRDSRIHSARDVERFLDLPVLLGPFPRKPSPHVSLASPRSRAGHAFTELGHTIAAALGQGNHVVAVVGTNRRAGGGVVAANLAAALARTHSDVVLVCANLEGTVVPELFGLTRGRGLAEMISGRAVAADVATRPADVPRLRVIGPGLDTSGTLYDLQHDLSERLMSQLRGSARYVVIELTAAGDEADTFTLAEFSDAALVVVETARTTRPAVDDCLRRLDRLRTAVLGAAVLPGLAGPPVPPRSAALAAVSALSAPPSVAQASPGTAGGFAARTAAARAATPGASALRWDSEGEAAGTGEPGQNGLPSALPGTEHEDAADTATKN
jgi:capsular polysaccharide biosynthesis protein/Mrp family chromosome partitioning ATPase